jgi:opacity protein-like surface antigen
MNLLKGCLVAALILFAAPALWAEESPDIQVRDSIFVNIGWTTPFDPGYYSTNQNPGYNGGVGYGFGLSKLFQLVIDANSDNFPLNYNSPTYSGQAVSGGNIRIGTLLANVRFRFLAQDNPVVPYLIGGMGGARVEQEAITSGNTVIAPASSTGNFAARFGIGIDIRLSPMTDLFVESNTYGIASNGGSGNFDYNSFRFGGKFNL